VIVDVQRALLRRHHVMPPGDADREVACALDRACAGGLAGPAHSRPCDDGGLPPASSNTRSGRWEPLVHARYSARRRLPMSVVMHDGTELAWVRLELDILASALMRAPLCADELVRFDALLRREREILGLDRRTNDTATGRA